MSCIWDAGRKLRWRVLNLAIKILHPSGPPDLVHLRILCQREWASKGEEKGPGEGFLGKVQRGGPGGRKGGETRGKRAERQKGER